MNESSIVFPQLIEALDLVVFDQKNTRMIVRLVDDEVVLRFANVLKKERVFYIHNFQVEHGGFGVHEFYHINIIPNTDVKEYFLDSPAHSFRLKDVSDIRKNKFVSVRATGYAFV